MIFAERSWLEQGCKVGEQVVPLARYFNNANVDMESGTAAMVLRILKYKSPLLSKKKEICQCIWMSNVSIYFDVIRKRAQ